MVSARGYMYVSRSTARSVEVPGAAVWRLSGRSQGRAITQIPDKTATRASDTKRALIVACY